MKLTNNKHKFAWLIVALLCRTTALAQEKPLEISTGTIITVLKQNAIDFGIRYVRSMDSIFKVQDILLAGNNHLFQASPDFTVQSGTSDAFSAINLKMTGLLMYFKTTTVADIKTPCTRCYMHLLPISAGIETNNTFTSINGIVEVGYVPWYQSPMMKNIPEWIKRSKIGVFVQAGYKFRLDYGAGVTPGGQADESKEEVNSEIIRAKGSFAIDTKSIFEIGGIGVGLIGSSDGWYDFVNSEVYYNVSGKARLYLNKQGDRYFDLKYQKGSGAPNFNQGEQYGVGLTVGF